MDLKKEILSNESEVQNEFLSYFREEVIQIVDDIETISKKVSKFDSTIDVHRQKALLTLLFHNIINNIYAATKLLIMGYFLPYGNLARHAIESLCIAILVSRGDLEYLEKILRGKFLSHQAVMQVIDHPDRYHMNQDATDILKEQRKWYHKFSHPSLFALSSQFHFGQEGTYYSGPFFDKSKKKEYQIELDMKKSFLKIIPNAIEGILQNAVWLTQDQMEELWDDALNKFLSK
jgi:hypothetical protein